MSESSIVAIDELELAFAPQTWSFADQRRDEIDGYFESRRRKTPELWNGRVLLLSRCVLGERRLSGTFFETDFASFLAWREWGCPDRTVVNCFGLGALRAADGAFLVGVMAAHTANAGRIYFPAGTPDPDDIRGSIVDLEQNVVREVAEETGLTPNDFIPRFGWVAVVEWPRIALFKILDVNAASVELRAHILDHLTRETKPEFTDIRILQCRDDLDPKMPSFVRAFLDWAWS
jgi:8-oxo-dGTP pyrophosphatase MutT (NUDIX family)